jgi:predicted RNA-binding Zn-ribbon protein involved in translation (DUF1610 family)
MIVNFVSLYPIMTSTKKRLEGVAMPYCQYCGGKIDKDAAVCPKCGESVLVEDTRLQESQIQEKVDEAKHRANMYVILAIILVTAGIMGGGILCVSVSSVGLFGIVFVCLGIGSTAWADRYERKAKNLKRQLDR